MRSRLLAVTLLLAPALALAADWPQWRGPHRDEISTETVQTSFGADGPKLLWTYDKAGNGYSSPAIVGNTLYSLGAGDEEFAFALDVDTGKERWRTDLGQRWVQRGDYGDGPRCTPTVDGDRLYLIRAGSDGEIHCLSTKDGKEIWKKSLRRDFGGDMMSGWGYSESPLVDGDKLLCTPGSKGGIVALDKKTGKEIWRCDEVKDKAAYSSIIFAEVFGVRQYIQMLEGGVTGVRADNGKMLWYYERKVRTAGIPTPVYYKNHVYSTAGYGVGCDLIKLTRSDDKFTAEKVYHNSNMVNHHGGVVQVDGFLYGYSDGRGWVCQDIMTGENKWEAKGQGKPGKGSITYADGHIWCYDEKTGTVHVAEASPKGWKDTGKIKLPKQSTIRSSRGSIWTHPVIANGKLYLRDQDLLFCFDVKK
jgi:outer membrane protein assembly factor BamB